MDKPDVRGLTLIELLVVMTLVGMFAGIAGPAIAHRLDTFSLQNTATELTSQFRKAEVLARTEQSPIIAVYANREFAFLDKNKKIAAFQLPSSISLAASELPPLLFLPSGQVVGPHQVELQNERGRRVVITIDFLAGMRVEGQGS